jgi:hypothetical protein
MRVLLAIISCHKRRHFVDAQRATWLAGLSNADYRIFLGIPTAFEAGADEVVLDVDDSYAGLPEKVKAAYAWALNEQYDYVLKMDDDNVLFPDRFLASGFEKWDYTGTPGSELKDFAAGFCYCLSARAMKAVVRYPFCTQLGEDRWVAQAIMNDRLAFHADKRYRFVSAPPRYTATRIPTDTIACCEFNPAEMRQLHANGGRLIRFTQA